MSRPFMGGAYQQLIEKKGFYMYKIIVGLVLVVGMVSVFASESDSASGKKWFAEYKADREPDIRGAIVYSDGKTDHFARAYDAAKMEIIEPDILHMNTIGTDQGTYFYKYIYDWKLDSEKGYTVEMRAKLNKVDVAGYESAAHLDVEDSSRKISKYWEISLIKLKDGKHYAVLAGKTRGKAVAIGKKFHVFKIEVKGNQATLFVDGQKQYSVEMRDNVNTNQIRFGDLTNKADADWEVDYIRIANCGLGIGD